MRETFEEKYNKKLKNKVSGVEFTNNTLNETINDFKNNINHLEDIVGIYNEILKPTIEHNDNNYEIIEDSIPSKSLETFVENIQIGPEEKKFNEWLDFEKLENGLIDFKVSRAFDNINVKKDGSLDIEYTQTYSREDFFQELNYINEAKAKGLCKPITNL